MKLRKEFLKMCVLLCLILSTTVLTFAEGWSGGNGGDGSSGISVTSPDWLVYHHSDDTGYRIYLVPTMLVGDDANVNVNTSYLDKYKGFALYEMNYDVDNALAYNGSAWDYILNLNSGANNLSSLFGDIGISFPDMESGNAGTIADWANTTLTGWDAARMQSFLSTYRDTINSYHYNESFNGVINDAMANPTHYAIVVEPVYQISTPDGVDVVLSYQDWIRYASDALNGSWNTTINNQYYSLGNMMYMSYDSQLYNCHISTQGDAGNTGFGIYYPTGDIPIVVIPPDTHVNSVHADSNITVRYNGAIKASSSIDNLQVDWGTTISDTLGEGGDSNGSINGSIGDINSVDLSAVEGDTGLYAVATDQRKDFNNPLISYDTNTTANYFANAPSIADSDMLVSYSMKTFNLANGDDIQSLSSLNSSSNISDAVKTALSNNLRTVTHSVTANTVNAGSTYTLSYADDTFNVASSATIAYYRGINAVGNIDGGAWSQVNLGYDDSRSAKNLVSKLGTFSLMNSTMGGVSKDDATFKKSGDSSFNTTVSILVPKTYVTSYISSASLKKADSSADAEVKYAVKDTSGTSSQTYLVQKTGSFTADSNTTKIGTGNDTSSTYVICYKNSDASNAGVNVADNTSIYNKIVSGLNVDGYNTANYVGGAAGAQVIKSAIKNTTGLSDFTVSYSDGYGTGVSTTVGVGSNSVSVNDGTLTGYNVLVLTVDGFDFAITSTTTVPENFLNQYQSGVIGNNASLYAYTRVASSNSNTYAYKANGYGGANLSVNSALNNTPKNVYNYAVSSLFDFGVEASNPKTIAAWNTPIASQAFILSRGVFGDAATVSTMTRLDSNIMNYLTQSGQLTSGNINKNTSAGRTSFGTSYDTFKWSTNKLLGYTLNGSPHSTAWYALLEYCNKFAVSDKDTAESGASGVIASTNIGDKVAIASAYKNSASVLTFYPEVKMSAYIPVGVYDTITSNAQITVNDIYVMAEKARKVKPSALYIINTVGDSINNVGKTDSNTISTGTDAKALSANLSSGNDAVIPAGSGINLSADINSGINFYGFALDVISPSDDGLLATDTGSYSGIVADGSNLKTSWGSTYDAKSDFDTWVSDTADKIKVSAQLIATSANGTEMQSYDNYVVSTGLVGSLGSEVLKTFPLVIKNGNIDTSTDSYASLIDAIARAYSNLTSNATVSGSDYSNAEAMFNNSDLYQSVIRAVESNSSWYDETVRTLVVREYCNAEVTLPNVLVEDKLDITAGPAQSTTNSTAVMSNGYLANWYLTLTLKDSTINGIPAGTTLFSTKVNGAEFIIPNASTNNLR